MTALSGRGAPRQEQGGLRLRRGGRDLLLVAVAGAVLAPTGALAQAANEKRGAAPNAEYYFCYPDTGSPPGPTQYGALTYRADLWGGSYCQWQPDSAVNNPPAPSAPTATSGSLFAAFETAQTQALTASGSVSGYVMVDQPTHGSAVIQGADVTYTPAPGYSGGDLFTWRANGPGGASNTATMTVTVSAPVAPVAGDASLSVGFEAATAGTLPASGSISSFGVAQPAHGAVVLQAGGPGYQYTPAAGYYGADSFSYTATGPGGTSGGTITVNVGLPSAPTAAADVLNAAFETAGSVQLGGSGVITGYAIAATPAHGAVALLGGAVTYTPAAGYIGPDSFTYTATGPGGTSAPATITVDVASPGVPAVQGMSMSTGHGAPVTETVAVSGNWDVVLVNSPPAHGTVSVNGQAVTYNPDAGFSGTDSFTLVAQGPGGVSSVATATVAVAEPVVVTPPPSQIALNAGDWSGTTAANTGLEVELGDIVSGAAVASFEVVRNPRHGGVSMRGGRATYRPAADFRGSDSFVYKAVAASGISDQGTVTISVVGGVVAIDHVVRGVAGKAVTVDLASGGSGGPFTGAEIVSPAPATAGAVTVTQIGAKHWLTFSPNSEFIGEVAIGYVLANSTGKSSPAYVRITIAARPDASRDRETAALVNSQAQAAVRFAGAQTANVMRRMESLHGGGEGGSSFSIGLPFASDDGPGFDLGRARARGPEPRLGDAASSPQQVGRNPKKAGNGAASVWAGGSIDYGQRKATNEKAKSKFATSGLSAGIDVRIADNLAVGFGVGYGADESEIGTAGTKSSADSVSAFAYGTFHPTATTYIDGMVGMANLDFTSRRMVEASGDIVTGARSGDQVFGAVAFGYEFQGRRLFVSPYGRVEFMDATLAAFTESGDDTYAMRYAKQGLKASTAVAGGRASYRFDLASGTLSPTVRMEYRYGLQDAGQATVSYADWAGSPLYQIDLAGFSSRNLVVGLGAQWKSVNGWTGWLEWETDALRQGGKTSRVKAGGGFRF